MDHYMRRRRAYARTYERVRARARADVRIIALSSMRFSRETGISTLTGITGHHR